MEDRPMYLGLIQVVNTHFEHRHPADRDERRTASLLPQLLFWLGKLFRGVRTGADEKSGKQN
jgi:hypothetical protein